MLSFIIVVYTQLNIECFGKIQKTSYESPSLLQLTTQIVSERYCAADPDLAILRLSLRLIYTNIGQQSLILYKTSNKIVRLMVSRSKNEALMKQYEDSAHILYVDSIKLQTYTRSALDKIFVIIKSGESYEIEGEVTIGVRRDNSNKPVVAGEHVLQVVIPTWPGTPYQAKRLSNRWNKKGNLWVDTITSEPMVFEVKKEPLIENCLP
jgi:hypothetical protein